MSSLKVWNCSLCEWFAAASLKAVVRHIGALHAHEAGFHICCGIGGCPRTYKNFASYRQHLYRVHRDMLDITDSSTASEDQRERNREEEIEDYCCDSDSNSSEFQNSLPLTLKHVGLFLLKAKEIYKVAETHLGSLMEDISHMIDLTVNHLEKEVQAELKHMGIAMSYEMRNVFHLPHIRSVFNRLRTKAQQQSFINENLEVVVSNRE